MSGTWICVRACSLAARGIVRVAPWVVAAYLAAHPLPAGCVSDCHFVIPPAEFVAGGMFAPGTPPDAIEQLGSVEDPSGTELPPAQLTDYPPGDLPHLLIAREPHSPGSSISEDPPAVPEPSSLLALGAALVALAAVRLRRRLPAPA